MKLNNTHLHANKLRIELRQDFSAFHIIFHKPCI
jgi:hypothetical protein